jgi:hypothetical protein
VLVVDSPSLGLLVSKKDCCLLVVVREGPLSLSLSAAATAAAATAATALSPDPLHHLSPHTGSAKSVVGTSITSPTLATLIKGGRGGRGGGVEEVPVTVESSPSTSLSDLVVVVVVVGRRRCCYRDHR